MNLSSRALRLRPAPHETARAPAADKRLAIPALVLACSLWGSAFAFGKLALNEITVSQLILLRFLIASSALGVVLIRSGVWPERHDLLRFGVAGLLAVPVTYLLQFHGLARTNISRASLIIGSMPPLLALGSAVFLRERLKFRSWAAIAASMLGIVIITGTHGTGANLQGDSLVLLSCVESVAWVMMNKRLSEKYGALNATSYLLLFGTIFLAPLALAQDGFPRLDLSPTAWISVIVLGLFCSALAFALWNWGVERIPVSKAGVFLNLEPLVGTLLGVVLWHDAFGPDLIFGGVLVIGAAIAATQPEQQEKSLRRHG
ncbi:MAG: EamA family transporter [Anaerolineales bacterium]